MSIFSRKQEVSLEDFCGDFYDNLILNQKVGELDASTVYPDYVKKTISDADNVFDSVDLQKLTDEIIILRFELFALAWLHKFGDKSAIIQSVFTKKFLNENGRDDIWNGMEEYNKAVSHSVTVGLEKINQAFVIRTRLDLADLHIANAKKNGIAIDEGIGRPVNRLLSENAWKKRSTGYFLILALCHRLGLGSGPNYLGPNENAQFQLQVFIQGLYDGAYQSFDDIKIKN